MIFYVEPIDRTMSVSVEGGSTFRAGIPKRLFAGRYRLSGSGRNYDVSADGRQFLMIKEDEASTPRSIVIVQNWQEELKRLVGTP